MALFADDIQRLRLIASRVKTGYIEINRSSTVSGDVNFLRELSDRILHELSEPAIFPWPGPDDEPEEHP